MSFDIDRLYKLLPSVYRIRDQELANILFPEQEDAAPEDATRGRPGVNAGPLRELLTVIAGQIAVLEGDLQQLYDDQFIETCAEWVVPYIGDLVGARGITVFPAASFSQRKQVANIIKNRSRKGTASVLAQLANDVTGWDSSVVEYFQLLATTQYINHIRPGNLSIIGLNNWETLEYLHTPFDKTARTADVRRIESNRGKYNIPNIGIFLWRLGSYSMSYARAFKVDERRYKFDALGKDMALYHKSELRTEGTRSGEPLDVPLPLSRRVMLNALEINDLQHDYGRGKSILVHRDGEPVLPRELAPQGDDPPLKLMDILSICNLSDLKGDGGNVIGWANMPTDKIAIDPVLGRLAFPSLEPAPEAVHVSYHYGFSAEVGGGSYSRTGSFTSRTKETEPVVMLDNSRSIQEALHELGEALQNEDLRVGIIEIVDNEYYVETPSIRVPKGKMIEIRARDGVRPIWILSGDLEIYGEEHATISFNGLLISGGCVCLPLQNSDGETNMLSALHLRHCTLLPGPSPAIRTVAAQAAQPRLRMEAPGVTITIDKSIIGAIRAAATTEVIIHNSIVDASGERKVAYSGLDDTSPGAVLTVENSTLIGKVSTRIMKLASNTIFFADLEESDTWNAAVKAQRLQQGCVRFSYLPPDVQLPRPYRCQRQESGGNALPVRPAFTSLRYGNAGYCQLSQLCPAFIKQGADDEAEMGVFHDLYQPQREANLRVRLNEYLRFGLEAGVYYGS